jgi:hypothetical protein
MNVLLEFDFNNDAFDYYKIYYNHVLVAYVHVSRKKEIFNSVLKFDYYPLTAVMVATINIKIFEYFGADFEFVLMTNGVN